MADLEEPEVEAPEAAASGPSRADQARSGLKTVRDGVATLNRRTGGLLSGIPLVGALLNADKAIADKTGGKIDPKVIKDKVAGAPAAVASAASGVLNTAEQKRDQGLSWLERQKAKARQNAIENPDNSVAGRVKEQLLGIGRLDGGADIDRVKHKSDARAAHDQRTASLRSGSTQTASLSDASVPSSTVNLADSRTLMNNIDHPGVEDQRRVRAFNAESGPKVERVARQDVGRIGPTSDVSLADSRGAINRVEAEAIAKREADQAIENASETSRLASRGNPNAETTAKKDIAQAEPGDRGVLKQPFERHATMSNDSRRKALEFVRGKGLDAPTLAEAIGDKGATIAVIKPEAHMKPLMGPEL